MGFILGCTYSVHVQYNFVWLCARHIQHHVPVHVKRDDDDDDDGDNNNDKDNDSDNDDDDGGGGDTTKSWHTDFIR